MSIQTLCLFFNQVVWVFLVLGCISFLYILDINLLSDKSFANIFSHSVGCLFILLMVSFAVQKLFSLMWSLSFIFASLACAFGVRSKNIIAKMSVEELTTYGFSLWLL